MIDKATAASTRPAQPDATAPSPCDSSRGRWTQIGYTDVDLGPRVHGGVGYITGPAVAAAIRSQEEWSRTWQRIADTVQTPKVDLRDSIIVVLATREFGGGPVKLDVVRVQLCRADGTASVEYRLRSGARAQDYGDRAIRAIAISRSAIGNATVRFDSLPAKIDN